MSDMVELTINGKEIQVPPDTFILEAARQNDIYIPTLCWDRRLKPYGGCRLCVVEVEGSWKLRAACSTPVTKGMVITTESEKLSKARKTVLELLLIHHPLDCPVCDKAGECDLQDLAFKYGPSENRFTAKRSEVPEDLAAPLVERNPNRCILCGKCVRICGEHQGVSAINLIGRGFDTIVSPAFEETLDCEFCGQCIDICPVGALGSKPYRFRSRVWFMDEQDIVCPYCGCGCTVTLGLREGSIIRSIGKDGRGISEGDLCGKGRFGFDYLYSENRLNTPLIKKGDKLEPATWEEALAYVGRRLSEIKEKHGPEAIGALGSQRCTVEDNYMFQKFMREVIGTNNIDSGARLGYAKAQDAIKRSFGLNRLPIKFNSPLEADAILVVESDVASTHPVFGLNIMRAARDMEAKLIVMDPKMTKLSRYSTEWLRLRPSTSSAVLNGMMKVILDEELHDKSAEGVQNFAAIKASLEEFTPEKVAAVTGVSADSIISAARTFAKAENRLLCMTVGESENTKGTDTVLCTANLLMLLGSGPEALQIPADLANTMGLFEAGVRPDAGPGHKEMENKGLDIYGMLYDENSPIKAMYIIGENPAVTYPRSGVVQDTLDKLELLVVQDIMMNDTAKMADVVLPASSWAEKEGTFVGATGVPQQVPKCIPETAGSVPDWKILRNLSRAMQSELGEMGYEELREEIDKNVQFGPDTAEPVLAFNVPGKDIGETTSDEYPFLMSVGTLMQHSGSLTSVSKSLGTVVSDAHVQINDVDAGRLNVAEDAYVKVTSKRGEVYLKARVTYEVPEGMIFVPGHFAHAKVNALTYPATNGGAQIVAVNVQPA
jgi:NADH-quinone oxidoreductase chain G